MRFQIDESLFYKAKYNRGGQLTRVKQWVFGMLERRDAAQQAAGTPCRFVVMKVADRTQATLFPLINTHIAAGTLILRYGMIISFILY